MEPTNNPMTAPNPNVSAVPPMPPMEPVAPAAPVAPVAPAAPAAPAAPVAPAPVPENPMMGAPAAGPIASSGYPTPPAVNPIIMPSQHDGMAPAAPAAPAAPQFNNAINNGGVEMLDATAPITMPEPAPAPDPVEEELKAPLKPFAPVPGSIGSAVSLPDENQPSANAMPNIFNANMQQQPVPMNAATKAKSKNTTLIILCVLATLVVLALVGVLVSQLM